MYPQNDDTWGLSDCAGNKINIQNDVTITNYDIVYRGAQILLVSYTPTTILVEHYVSEDGSLKRMNDSSSFSGVQNVRKLEAAARGSHIVVVVLN